MKKGPRQAESYMKYAGTGHVRGYAGLVHTALAISEYIPKCSVYVEPFAGLGRVAKHITNCRFRVLNDLSEYAFDYLRNHFSPRDVISFLQFDRCIKEWDEKGAFFLIDPPWSKSEYQDGCHNRAFIDRTPKEYYDKIIEMLPSLKGNWFLCGNKDNKRLLNPRYYSHLFKSKKKIMGGNISTLVMSNKPFVRYHQTTLHSLPKQARRMRIE